VAELPTGTVTFLFTDVEGSTRLLHELGDRYAEALAEHRRALREAFVRHGGVEVDTQGDAFFVAFAKASDALAAAATGCEGLASGPVRVRMGVHTGEPVVTEEGYVGLDVHRAARIAAAGHGGQILVSQSTRDLAGSDALQDLGEHRLKDLSAPERIYQLGPGEFPRLKSLNQTNLPVQPTPLVGRERELHDVLELVHSSRLLTLTGAGGSGKTRLALQAAAELVDVFPDGVWFVSLAPLTDPRLIRPTISQVIGARDGLAEFLRGRKLLLLLDNVEQLLPDAAVTIAGLDTPVIATSRERLSVSGEQEYQVPTLPLNDAAALFTARARQLNALFHPDEQVIEIVRKVDGLPLAVELAAAWVKVLPPAQILERLGHSLDLLTAGARDAPERHRTLRATIQWSHDLLSPMEQDLFAALAVFPGSFDLGAAEAVCDADLPELQSLVDKSLLQSAEQGRFFMLETIREYALEQLDQTDVAAALPRKHALFFAKLAEDAGPHVKRGEGQPRWLDRLELEQNNLRAALDYLERANETDLFVRATCDLWHFWWIHSHLAEGSRWLESALKRTEPGSSARFGVFEGAAFLAYLHGDLERSRRLSEAFLEEAQHARDAIRAGMATHQLANVAVAKHAYEEAIALEEASLALLGDDPFSNYPRSGLAYLSMLAGDLDRAEELLRKVLEFERHVGDFGGIGNGLGILAIIAAEQGRDAEAVDLIGESAAIAQRIGHEPLLAQRVLQCAALILARRGEAASAITTLAVAQAIVSGLGGGFGPLAEQLYERTWSAASTMLDERSLATAQQKGLRIHREGSLDMFVAETLRALD
jgi:predicted ATPase